MTPVEICNTALSHIGNWANISSLEDKSPAGQACGQHYPTALRSTLEQFPWNFAMRRRALALLTNEPAYAWRFVYAMPEDSVKVIRLLDEKDSHCYKENPPQFTVELAGSVNRQIIRTNLENAHAQYTAKSLDTTLYSEMFCMAVSWLLASLLAGKLIKGAAGMQVAQSALQMYTAIGAQAANIDATQHQEEIEKIPPGIRARWGHPYGRPNL